MLIFLVTHASLVEAASVPNSELLARSANFSNILRDSSNQYLTLADGLRKDGTWVKAASAVLKAVAVVELTYVAWVFGGPLVTMAANSSLGVLTLAGLARFGLTAGVGLAGPAYAIQSSTKNLIFKETQAKQEFEKIRDQILSERPRDISIRLQKFETVQAFKYMPKLDQLSYLEQRAQQLTALSNVYRAARQSLDKKLDSILEAHTPSEDRRTRNRALGGDQIVFANTVVAGLTARSELNEFFISLNEEYMAEYAAAEALIQQ